MSQSPHASTILLHLLDHPICFQEPGRTAPSRWLEHIPFAMFLVDVLRPRVLVELGTDQGTSYCAFCQAVLELQLDTRCYAIDTWEGLAPAGSAGAEVHQQLRAYHDPLYGSFSTLLQSTFDEALSHFADHTIDLLHLDGCPTYDAVKHDFESWLPKMSTQGVILFHDVNVLEREFGVHKLWDEIKPQYPHFEFLHGSGLGILSVGQASSTVFQALLKARDQEACLVRKFFFNLGHPLEVRHTQLADLAAALASAEGRGEQLQEEVRDLREQLTQAEEAAGQLQEKLAALTQKLAQAEETANQREETVCLLSEKLAETEESAVRQEEEIARLTACQAEHQEALQRYQVELSDLAASLDQSEQMAGDCVLELEKIGGDLTAQATVQQRNLGMAGNLQCGLSREKALLLQSGEEFQQQAAAWALLEEKIRQQQQRWSD